ncbi:MAG: hypothetical protein J6112_05925 [Clostridia bacterium]|nr:hypothetical protein [Clostridia bacterium]
MLSRSVEFKKAKPVWAAEHLHDMNVSLMLETSCGLRAGVLRIAAASCYQLFVNGELANMGPARTGHGFARVDEVPLPSGRCDIKLIAAGYNNNSFQYIDEPPFVCAEIIDGDTVVAATDPENCGFKVRRYFERLQKTTRYSFQRNFTEVYDLRKAAGGDVKLSLSENKCRFIERGIALYPNDREDAKYIVAEGLCGTSDGFEPFADRAITRISDELKGFKPEELEICSAREGQKLTYKTENLERRPAGRVDLKKDGFAVFEMERNLCGVIGFSIECEKDCRVYAMFDELLGPDGSVDFLRLGTSAIVIWDLPEGNHSLLTFEPYLFKYLKIAVTGTAATIRDVHIRRVGFPKPGVRLKSEDPKMKAVFDAAVETFRENTYDIFMDCPSRERAGWLCDSFFTSRVEHSLTGSSAVERNFLENFLLPASFKCLPEGMLPMCYPADHYDRVFIPNWAMWFVVELEEYLERTGDRELIGKAKDRVYALLKYFRKFENELGLLEKLESWIFIEWSRSNELVQDVSFPSNMLYAKVKRTVAKLYGDEVLVKEAEALENVIREKSFDGRFFRDNMVRVNGKLVSPGECTESCQYYAFHTGIATPDTYPELWETLLRDFGPGRKQNDPYPNIAFANAFIGNYLRLDIMHRYGRYDEILDNIKGYFFYMADRTGTLWELDSPNASCSHGFASHVIYWLDRMDMLEKDDAKGPEGSSNR